MVFRRTEQEDRDLGFGAFLAGRRDTRLVNRDGSFGVVRVGHGLRAIMNFYHSMLTTSWPRFLGFACGVYMLFNALFAFGYLACGPDAIGGPRPGGAFLQAFFLAVQTSSTVGYGQLVPVGLAANLVMTMEAVTALVMVALGTGLIFARFSRPRADFAWSRSAVVAPYRGITGLMFRLANRRRNQIFDLHAKVILSMFGESESAGREFHELELERTRVSFLPLSWTVVHPIDEQSPLHGLDYEQMCNRGAEVIVLVKGTDATTSQDVHAWTSYTTSEIAWNARFVRIFESGPPIQMDVGKIDEVEVMT